MTVPVRSDVWTVVEPTLLYGLVGWKWGADIGGHLPGIRSDNQPKTDVERSVSIAICLFSSDFVRNRKLSAYLIFWQTQQVLFALIEQNLSNNIFIKIKRVQTRDVHCCVHTLRILANFIAYSYTPLF